jgi:hypothetical protein
VRRFIPARTKARTPAPTVQGDSSYSNHADRMATYRRRLPYGVLQQCGALRQTRTAVNISPNTGRRALPATAKRWHLEPSAQGTAVFSELLHVRLIRIVPRFLCALPLLAL